MKSKLSTIPFVDPHHRLVRFTVIYDLIMVKGKKFGPIHENVNRGFTKNELAIFSSCPNFVLCFNESNIFFSCEKAGR